MTTKKDFAKAKRKQFVSRIITGDYDAIVIGDSQFEKIPMSREKQVTYINDKLEQLREIKLGSDSDYTVKEAERSIKGLEHQLEELQKLEQDTFIEFENLGIDFLLWMRLITSRISDQSLDLGMSRVSPIPLQKERRHGNEGETGSGRAWR